MEVVCGKRVLRNNFPETFTLPALGRRNMSDGELVRGQSGQE